MSENPIGIFDSGVGGLTVLKEIIELMPNENYLYFGDTARVPYGEKTKEQLTAYVRGIMEWYRAQNVKAVVMACNSSSAIVYESIKDDYNFPVFSLIEPTAEYISYVSAKKIGILATRATVTSKAYTKAIERITPSKEVIEVACPGLVEIIESNKADTNEARKLVVKYVIPLLEKGVEKIILGCTHYPFLGQIIEDIANDREILADPAKQVAEKVAETLLPPDLISEGKKGSVRFYVSSNAPMFIEAGRRLYPEISEAHELYIGEITKVIK